MLTSILLTLFAQYQSPGAYDRVYPAPTDYRFDGAVQEWLGDFSDDEVVLAANAHGLIFAGRRFPSVGERVHLYLAAPRDFDPPPPGSLGRFGYAIVEDCKKAADLPTGSEPNAAKCAAWLAQTREHHNQLRRLLQRHYVLTSTGVEEVSATPAWQRVQLAVQELPKHLKSHPLAPGVRPRVMITSESFEAEIPWAALPPMEHTPLTTLRWAWRIGDDAKDDDPSPRWKTAALAQPRRYRISECDLSPNFYPGADNDPVWYVPGATLLVHDVVSFRYPMQFFWEPTALSPEIHIATSFEERLEPGVWFCGPSPAQNWRGQSSIPASPWLIYRGGFPAPGKYRRQRLPDGTWLIATAPEAGAYGFFGGGQCGACTVWTSYVWRLTPSGISIIASFESGRIDPSGTEHTLDWDVHYGPDLRLVDVYSEEAKPSPPGEIPKSAGWTRQRHCYQNGTYRACGPAVRQAPQRRVTKPASELYQ